MALHSLLRCQAILDLCNCEVVLPSVDSVAQEPLSAESIGRHVRRHFRALQSRFGPRHAEVPQAALRLLDPKCQAQAASAAPACDRCPSLAIMAETLQVACTLLTRWAREEPGGKVPLVAQAAADCQALAFDLLQVCSEEEPKEKLLVLLQRLVAQLQALPPGGMAWVPIGWLRRSGLDRAEGEDGGHLLIIVLVRHLTDKDFTLAVVNAGEGLQYHPVRPCGKAPRPEMPERQCPLIMCDVPSRRVTCGTFWYLLFRQLIQPSESNGPKLLYSTLLPMLKKQPLAASFGHEPEGWAEFCPVPIAGDGSFMQCFLRTVRFSLRACGATEETAAWVHVQFRRYVVEAIGAPSLQGEDALLKHAGEGLARAAAEHATRFGERYRHWEMDSLKTLVQRFQERSRHVEAVCPELPESLGDALHFQGFERLREHDVEAFKGEVNPPRVCVSVPLCELPTALRDPFDASSCCRAAVHLLSLLCNQSEHISQSALTRFALISRLLTQVLPMPLPLDHPHKESRCFWMQEMKQETKVDLMRHLVLIARHFAASCFTLRARREADGARVVVSAALGAVMDALLRRCLTDALHGSLASRHYSGQAEGPGQAFGVEPGLLQEASESLLLVAPEYQALRTLVLDYFQSVSRLVTEDHMIFAFDKSMACSEGDRTLVEQIGLCLGLEAARRDAHLLLSGERPELFELFPEIAWFRDTVFLWKMLLLPACQCPAVQKWSACDSLLKWQYRKGRFEVFGFGMALTPEASTRPSFLQGMLQWFGQYESDKKSLSRASPSVLTGSEILKEDDVLFLKDLPSFNGALGAGDVELLLSYLTAPYLRIPLLLSFFADRHRASALREPQLQMILDAALFEPGCWQQPGRTETPGEVPAPNRRHLATAAGLLFNELMRSPQAVLRAVLSLLQVVVEKDVGRPGSANDGLILYVVRLASRVESYVAFLVSHGRRGAYLERSGASYEALVRSLAGLQDAALITELEVGQQQLGKQLRGDVLSMLQEWLHYAAKRPELLSAACRIHAHVALIFKNVPAEEASVSSFLAAQAFLNINHRWLEDAPSSGEDPLGVGEVELFDAFEARRGRIAGWLRECPERGSSVLRMVEKAVTNQDSKEMVAEEWSELQPGDFVPKKHLPGESWFRAQPGEAFPEWILRMTQGGVAGRQVSVNLGQYGTQRDGLEMLPGWAMCNPDFQEAFGRLDVHCVEREAATKRVWKDLVGHDGFSIQRWLPDDVPDPHPVGRASVPPWALTVLQPVLSALPQLKDFHLGVLPAPEKDELWFSAVPTAGRTKELRVQRDPPLVEVYTITEHGRHFYRTLVFSSDTMWSFHAPCTDQRLLRNAGASVWSVAAGDVVVGPKTPQGSVVVLRDRKTHLPRRFLRGLLPDALLQRYRFWRQGGEILGDELAHHATRLQIQLSGGSARVQRSSEELSQPEVLVNLRRWKGLHLLARLENLSHILVWTGASLRVELPRLRLSFCVQKKRLYCEQHRGFWVADKECQTAEIAALLAQWGGGAVLLQNQSRELRVLVSALAEPIRPAEPAVDGFLPSPLVLRRDNEAWLANLEGSRHYCYPVHLSGAFAFAPTQAAKLYLLLCRFFTWHFEEAAAAAFTISEVSSKEEKQLWERLCLAASAVQHPDAAASCLRLSLSTSPYGMASSLDTSQLLLEYVRKRHLVSASCRLSVHEEMQLLSSGSREGRAPELKLRHQTLQAAAAATNPQRLELAVRLGDVLEDDNFDRVCDKTFTEDVGIFERISSTLRDVTYNRPEVSDLKGVEAMVFVDGLFSIFGPSANAAFPFLYELFTMTMSVQVLPEDDAATVASTLLRICGGSGAKSAGLSVLRILELNPEVCGEMPKWGSAEHAWSFGLGGFKMDTQSTSKLLEAASRKLNGYRSLVWPTPYPPAFQPAKVVHVTAADAKGLYWWAPPSTQDVGCKSRRVGKQSEQFAGQPLKQLAAKFIHQETGKGLGPGVAAVRKALRSLRGKAMAAMGEATLDRLLKELDTASESQRFKLQKAARLAQELEDQRAEDARHVQSSLNALEELVTDRAAVDWLRRASGVVPRIGLCSLVSALMAEEGSPSATGLQDALPSLGEEELSRMWELVASVLLHTVRMGQVARAQQALEEYLQERHGADSVVSSRAVALQLGEERHLTWASGQELFYDPRLLVFEFLCNLMLRKSQVELIRAFVASAEAGKSVCQQMLMGEGKTTVIAPVLVLLLAQSSRLVCACMPAALLDMSRAVLAERFSSPVLPRPVLTLEFHRQVPATQALLSKLEAACQAKAAVIAAPNSVKSILLRRIELLLELHHQKLHRTTSAESQKGSWLRFPSWLSNASDEEPGSNRSSAQEQGKVEEVRLCGAMLGLFHSGLMLLDEVDLLLDPLRSELNWPLGKRFPLDMTGPGRNSTHRSGFRYTLPFDLLDAIFAAATGCAEIVPSSRREAHSALGGLAEKIKQGRKSLKVQVTPHFVLLSRDFYTQEMLPHLADWAALFVDEHLEGVLLPNDLRVVLRDGSCTPRTRQLLQNASEHAMRALTLTLSWLHHVLPYILSKVHRVSYGLLTTGEERGSKLRMVLAVPFVGKDTPSSSSEFSHPDVAIGFTILSYRLNGLRPKDVLNLLQVLLDEMRAEGTLAYHRRAACQAYVAMMVRAGRRVRGFTKDGQWLGDEARKRDRGKAAAEGSPERRHLWPLELLDISDPEQIHAVSDVLRFSPLAIRHLLEHHVFVSGTLDRNEMQLSASGQELAGPQLFGACLGFSGTPNDLLPKSMGRCIYAEGDDGTVLQALSNTETVTAVELGQWSPSSILDLVATAQVMRRPKYQALIDAGALVTGMSNAEVAEYLLTHGLHGLDGVLFLNERNERVVLERDSMKIVELAQCGLSPAQRFTFYDHVHTTGMDVKQPLLCTAALTLSKDMTLRDYAQGAYRMRGIGHGQNVEVLMTPEVRSLMNKSLSSLEKTSEEVRAGTLAVLKRKPEAWNQAVLVDLLSWLVLNGIRAEARKRHLLLQQDLQNLWRAAACLALEDELTEARQKKALFCLLSSLDFRVSEKVPGEGEESVADRWRRAVARHVTKGVIGHSVWPNEAAREEALLEADRILRLLEETREDEDFNLSKEQVQEQEQEHEEEVEQDHEQEVQLEEDVEKVPEAAAEQRYARDSEEAVPWPLNALTRTQELPFYPMAEFAVNKGIFNESSPTLAGLPHFVMLSDNYYRRQWRLTSVRRLRNVICFLEWVPSVKRLRRFSVAAAETQRLRLREALRLCAGACEGFGRDEVRALCNVLDLTEEGKAFTAKMSATSRVSLVDLEKELLSQGIYKMQQGRFFAALSLEEAEHLRGTLHLLKSGSLPDECGIALRCLSCKASGTLLDWHGPVLESVELGHQLEAAEQSLRFLNNAEDFQASEVSVLLRTLQLTRLENRLPWWLDVRACRRRSHRPWQRSALAKVFEKTDELEDWATMALLLRLRWALAAHQLWPADAFRLFDVGNNGCLQRKDLAAGLEQMGVCEASDGWMRQVEGLFRRMALDGREVVFMEEFRAALEIPADWEVAPSMASPMAAPSPEADPLEAALEGLANSSPLRGAEGFATPQALSPSPDHFLASPMTVRCALTAEMCQKRSVGRFKVKWQKHSAFRPIWTDGLLSIWVAYELVPRGSFMGLKRGSNAVKERVSFGHVVATAKPSVQLLEVTDEEHSGFFAKHPRDELSRFLATFFPHPIRFRPIWSDPRKHMYVWAPVAPSADYVCAGMLCTNTEEAPSLEELRCMPRLWAERRPRETLFKAWSHGGAEGVASMWLSGEAGLLQVSLEDPTDIYEMPVEKFYVSLPQTE